jgi:hypothetical protein
MTTTEQISSSDIHLEHDDSGRGYSAWTDAGDAMLVEYERAASPEQARAVAAAEFNRGD